MANLYSRKQISWFSSILRTDLCHRSNVLENITANTGLREKTAICFAYYNYQDAELANVSRVIAALIKQLCQRKVSIPNKLLQIKRDARSPSVVGTQRWFISLVEDLSEVFVVFDALDECPEQKREEILSFITGTVIASGPCRIKIFVTSRKEMDIAKAFQENGIPTIQIRAENVATDIETFARNKVEKLCSGEHGKTLYITRDDLKEKVVQVLVTKAEGM